MNPVDFAVGYVSCFLDMHSHVHSVDLRELKEKIGNHLLYPTLSTVNVPLLDPELLEKVAHEDVVHPIRPNGHSVRKTKKKIGGPAGYWARLTAAERSKEMKKRQRVAAANKVMKSAVRTKTKKGGKG